MWAIWLVSLNFTAHAEILLRACADQLLYNLSLIRLCSACIKQSSEDCKQCLFVVSKIKIIWSGRTRPEFVNCQLWTS